MGNISYNMGYEKISLLSVQQCIHVRNRSEATCFNIPETPNRCVSKNTEINLHALPYNFHIAYIPGKQILIADALSRNLKISEDKEEDQISLPIVAVNYITSNYQQYAEKFIMNRIREKHPKMPHCNYWQDTSPMVGQCIKRKFLKSYILTGITEMKFP